MPAKSSFGRTASRRRPTMFVVPMFVVPTSVGLFFQQFVVPTLVGLFSRLKAGLQTGFLRNCRLACGILAVWFLFAAGQTVPAATFTVGKGGGYDFDTIQAAIDAATSGDYVVVYPATYVENINFNGKSIVLRSTNPADTATVAATIIDGDSSGSVVTFKGSETSSCVLQGFTIRKGWADNGGGINGQGTLALIQNCQITSNSALNGGGLYRCNGIIQDNTITANTANSGAGLNECNGVIQRSKITGNWGSNCGGGLSYCGAITVNNTITSNSSAWAGGGLYECHGLIHNNTITSNVATCLGGGLYGCYGTISDNVISHNAANWGGGLLYGGIMMNNIITYNRATMSGGVGGCNLLVNNTIVGNSAGLFGGVGYLSGPAINCIIWGNTAPSDPQLERASTPTCSCIQGWTGGGVGNISADPLFATGPLGVYYLSQRIAGQSLDSPCVDAGSSTALALGLNAWTTRTDHGPDLGVVDMGYHYPPHILPPFIGVSPTRFVLATYQGRTVAAQTTILLVNVGGETAVYTITTSPLALVGVRPTSGTLQSGEQRTHEVYFNTATVAPGYYEDGFLITWNAPDGRLFVPVMVSVLPVVDLYFAHVDITPTAPVQLRPYDPIVVSALVEGGGAGEPSFWIEVWGSRTGGLTLDRFLADSKKMDGSSYQPYSWDATQPLYSIPDGPYTVVYAVDRLGEVPESNTRNNRAVVAGKRILVIRPQTNIDLAVEGFGMSPNPANSGQQATFSGRVVNRGSEDSGPFWIEFWGSWEKSFPALNFFLCDSIYVENLDASATIELSQYPRPLYSFPSVLAGTFTIGCFADRDDSINELDETNNYQFVDGQVFNQAAPVPREANKATTGPDIRIVVADFSPAAPTQLAPGDPVTFTVDLVNSGTLATGPFWLEYWGSRDGGVTLSNFLAISDVASNLAPGESRHTSSTKSLLGIPDGPYSVVVLADRLNHVAEADKLNNRRVIAGKRLLVIRPPTGADLTINIQGVNIVNSPPQLSFSGEVLNNGTADSGPFWVEFWLCPGDADYPWLNRFACDSLLVNNLPAHGSLNLSSLQPLLYNSTPPGEYTLIGFVDRLDQVNETDETNNFALLRHFTVPNR